jgi:minor histocompatibility antigen H13
MGIIEDAIERLFPIEYSTKIVVDYKFNLNLVFTSKEFHIKLTKLNFLSLLIAMLPLSVYLGSKNWICNNLFGIAFTVSGVANFTVIPNFKVFI